MTLLLSDYEWEDDRNVEVDWPIVPRIGDSLVIEDQGLEGDVTGICWGVGVEQDGISDALNDPFITVVLNEPTKAERDALSDLQDRIDRLLGVIGTLGTCKGCGAAILWVTTKNGKPTLYDLDGETHWATCPKAGDFKRGRR